jgi:hypothetical protein
MARAQKSSRPARPDAEKAFEPDPQQHFIAPRKRPLLLGIAALLLVAWIVFLAAMAWR